MLWLLVSAFGEPYSLAVGGLIFTPAILLWRAHGTPADPACTPALGSTNPITEIEMQAHRNPSRTLGLLTAGLLLVSAAGCGPIVFEDASALAISGAAPVEAQPEPPPPEPEKRVVVRDNRIIIKEKIQFEFNSAKIKNVSHSLLDEVAKEIKEHPQIKKIEIQGHASAEGSDGYNLKLSDKRAKAVRKYLSGQGGIDNGMLLAKGYGESQPIASNDTEEGKEKNRRVEFLIVEQEIIQTKVEIDDKGNEKVIEEKKVDG